MHTVGVVKAIGLAHTIDRVQKLGVGPGHVVFGCLHEASFFFPVAKQALSFVQTFCKETKRETTTKSFSIAL